MARLFQAELNVREVWNGSIPVVAAASAPSPLFPPTADIAHSGHESQLLAMSGHPTRVY